MKMISKVLLDTCFLIELADKNKPCHKTANEYYNFFQEKNIDCYLSPIVVSEYWHNDLVEDFPIENFKHLTFNIIDGHHTGQIAKTLKNKKGKVAKGVGKHAIKDDYKLLAQLIVNNEIDCFITKDGDLIKDYASPLKEIFPALKKVRFININTQPIESTLKPQRQIKFAE
jgi:hypothetical protein